MMLVADRRRLLRLHNVIDTPRNERLTALIDNDWLGIAHLLACLLPPYNLLLEVCLWLNSRCVKVDDLIVLSVGTFIISHLSCR